MKALLNALVIMRGNFRLAAVFIISILLMAYFVYFLWTPGKDFADGRHDLKRNGMWLQHGWLGNDHWFITKEKTGSLKYFRDPNQMQVLASLLREHNIKDIFPHMSPTYDNGQIPLVESDQIIIFLDIFKEFRVMPWVGGVVGKQAFPGDPDWRKHFTDSISRLLSKYPQLAGIHINIEPCPAGNKDFLLLLEAVRMVLPKKKVLSIAAYPPPTLWHPFKSVHWDEEYYKQVSQRSDQLVVMMYDTSIWFKKVYRYVMATWTREILEWTKDSKVLLGLPAYADEWARYHNPTVENLNNALPGVHKGLSKFKTLPHNYQGIAIYSEWEMDQSEWEIVKKFNSVSWL